MPVSAWDDGDEDEASATVDGKRLKEWDCPACNANNPCDETISSRGVELRCNYCGVEFRISLNDQNRVKLKEI